MIDGNNNFVNEFGLLFIIFIETFVLKELVGMKIRITWFIFSSDTIYI